MHGNEQIANLDIDRLSQRSQRLHNPDGKIWYGNGDQFHGNTYQMKGQSHSDWKTDVDYDGFDWDWLPDKSGSETDPPISEAYDKGFYNHCGCKQCVQAGDCSAKGLDCSGTNQGTGLVSWADNR